jgi:hypothetical protein
MPWQGCAARIGGRRRSRRGNPLGALLFLYLIDQAGEFQSLQETSKGWE